MRSLLASLNEHPMALLRGIAELRGVILASNARAEAAAQLASALAEPAATSARAGHVLVVRLKQPGRGSQAVAGG